MSGYSGAAIKPIALHFIAEMAQCAELGLPLSAMGGVETWIDALEYLLVGATTVQVTTGIIKYGYRIVQDMIEGLSDYMVSRGITRAEDLIGKALPNLKSTDHFDLARQGIAAYDIDKCVGCGQCYTVCRDAGGQALEWDEAHAPAEARRGQVPQLHDLQLHLPRAGADHAQGNAEGLGAAFDGGHGPVIVAGGEDPALPLT